jgi:hypothetical protein
VRTSGVDVTGNLNATGTLGVTGNVAVNTNKFTVEAASGNTAVAGTLGVAGEAAFNGNGALKLPVGTTAQRPTGTAGMVRQNSTTGTPEWYDAASSVWVPFSNPTPTGAPAFSAYANGGQTLSNNTFTKMQCSTEQFDTNSNFDTANYRFTPTVAGYYNFSVQASITATTNVTRIIPAIYKNGAAAVYGNDITATGASRATLTWLAYMNGSTDYVEFYAYATGTGTITANIDSGLGNFFQGYLVRRA